MKFKEKIMLLYDKFNEKFNEQFGFEFKEASFAKVVDYLHAPKHASSLAVTRILFGLTMLFDIPDERGGAVMKKRWGDPKTCHFPLFSFIQALPMPYMTLVYASLWIGAIGIMLGYKYRITAPLFVICYWYLFLIEKSYWNNHSYLFGLVSFLLACTKANCYWSIDALIESNQFSETVPYWNYFILKYQFFILYFIAGVKKGTAEWLTGYSVPNLSEHWVFTPFTLFLTTEQTDYIVVHWFIFLFDLTVAFWMMWSRSRHIAMIFCALFHLMNSRLFTIGMFPWVCLATLPLFYPFDWPILIFNTVKSYFVTFHNSPKNQLKDEPDKDSDDVFKKEDEENKNNLEYDISHDGGDENKAANESQNSENDHNKIKDVINKIKEVKSSQDLLLPTDDFNNKSQTCHMEVEYKKKITTLLIIIFMALQGFLPFSHFITKGYNNWTDGLYGYSWDMMVHTWDVQSVVVKIVDNENDTHFYLNPHVHTPNDRWFKHGDMVQQYAKCIKSILAKDSTKSKEGLDVISQNISIYIDVWCSMNGRFVQRMFDSKADLLRVSWSLFEPIPFLMPLIDEGSEWRSILNQIKSEVHSWDQYSDVVFFADFPGYYSEKFIPPELSNVTLTVLQGQIALEPEVTHQQNGQSYQLKSGYRTKIDAGMFHRVLNIGQETAFYMYTFLNTTEADLTKANKVQLKDKLPIFMELKRRFTDMVVFGDNALKGFYQMFFRLPMFLV